MNQNYNIISPNLPTIYSNAGTIPSGAGDSAKARDVASPRSNAKLTKQNSFSLSDVDVSIDHQNSNESFDNVLNPSKKHNATRHPKTSPALQARNTLELEKDLWHGRGSAAGFIHEFAHQMKDMSAQNVNRQGMINGVICPCMANILGVLLFLRLPWIVGLAGVWQSLLLVGVGCLTTLITSISLSAVATNGKIMGGGSYFLISRSLGPSLGAGVGLGFYFANSIGAAMYILGTVECWETAAGADYQIAEMYTTNNLRFTGWIILVVLVFIVGIGLKYVAKISSVLLAVVLFVIICMYVGSLTGPRDWGTINNPFTMDGVEYWWGLKNYLKENWGPAYEHEQNAFPNDTTKHGFISLLAYWFPACTGIMAGSNRSADLANPSKSIPFGTLFAQNITSIIYLSFCVVYGAVASREILLNDRFFAATSAWPHKSVIVYGVMASTIGAALQSLVSATRLLAAIAADGTLPILRHFKAKPGQEPKASLLASAVLCFGAIALAKLDIVAPIITMFFLMCYLCINMSCAMLEILGDPNWRPTFKCHHWCISVSGVFLCVSLMIIIDWGFALLAFLFAAIIFSYVAHNSYNVHWGDGFSGMKFHIARNILAQVDIKGHVKNWRPQILMLSGLTPDEDNSGLVLHDQELMHLTSQLKGGQGLTIIGGLVDAPNLGRGSFLSEIGHHAIRNWNQDVQTSMKEMGMQGFAKVVYTPSRSEGILALIQTS